MEKEFQEGSGQISHMAEMSNKAKMEMRLLIDQIGGHL
jgi:hypothetical protein